MNSLALAPNGGSIVSMVMHKGILIVATAHRVYQLSEEGVFTVVMFEGDKNE